MPALASDLRRTLENTVVKARELAERGARDALTALAVGASEPFASMSEEERKLRNRLRAHGRQLGNQRDPQKGTQSIERLVREMAYEHWHRMLFARFLAENQLLIEPSSGVAISLDECEELAAEEGTDLWGLAAQFAQEMLPQIFRVDDPVLAAKLPLEIRQQLQGLVAGLDAEVFTASDSLGWTYQYWQTAAKEAVNKSGVKIGADELPSATQLFTEDYMVDFLLDNTLGAWHAGKVLALDPQLAIMAQSEEELRQAVSLPGCTWTYLRFIQDGTGQWMPAAGIFDEWPKTAAELKCIDPCMGSGHFVAAMFERLAALRLSEESRSEESAAAAVIRDNLFGLEIDARCTQIAAFNLALAAWRHVGYCRLPPMNLACSGTAPNANEAEWLAIAGDNERVKNSMSRLHRLFSKASIIGSLANPGMTESSLLETTFSELAPLLDRVLVQESIDENSHELAVTAQGLAKAARILADKYTLVATNVPFLARLRVSEELQSYLVKYAEDAKTDLATVFIQRCLDLCHSGSTCAIVSPQSWLFLGSYDKFRNRLLRTVGWDYVACLGPKSFQTPMWDFSVMLISLTLKRPVNSDRFLGLDVARMPTPGDKSASLCSGELVLVGQSDQLSNPDGRVSVSKVSTGELLSQYANAWQGIASSDFPRFGRSFFELPCLLPGWRTIQSTVDKSTHYGGREYLLYWQDGYGDMAEVCQPGASFRGKSAWGKSGVAVSQMGKLSASIYTGDLFDVNTSVVVPFESKNLPAIWAFCSSEEFHAAVRQIDQALKVTNSTLVKVPFDLPHWQRVVNERYAEGLPTPFSSDPTQWLFCGNPLDADHPLHVAVARLVGYVWPRQTGTSFPDCPAIQPDELESMADADGIVCLAPIRGEVSAVEGLRRLLSASFKEEWSSAKERELLMATAVENKAKKAETDLESWLRNSFFVEHCRLFRSRPFVWQIWDGNPYGFSALVNYHKLAAPCGRGRKTLEQLTFTYLGDWIDRQKLDQVEGVNGADDRLAAALDLQGQLKKILDGEPPYDIFVRWKPLQQQSIGWDPDINDGVRLNIRPFLNAQLRKGGKAGAGVLRAKPGTIKWSKDRGKEPIRSKDEFPWFWGWDESNRALETDFGAPIPGASPAGDIFEGNRWNDLHYTRAAKEAARAGNGGMS